MPLVLTSLEHLAINFWHQRSFLEQVGVAVIVLVVLFVGGMAGLEWIKGPISERFIEGVRVVSYKRLGQITADKDKAKRHLQILFGEVPWPSALQDKHALIVGTTGVGKSTLIRQLLPRLRARGGRAIIVDLNGEFAAKFLTKSDKIFNPLDPKAIKWNPISEIRSPGDIDLVLKAAVPTGTSAEEENWLGYSRQFLRAIMLRLYETGELRLDRLRHYVMDAGDKEVAAFLQEGKNPYRLQANNMASTVKTVTQNCIQSLDHGAVESEFSIREWVRKGTGFIFITPRDRDRAALTTLINAFLNLAMAEALSPPTGKRYRPISVVVDELASFDFDDLEGVLEKGRKFGLVAFAGIQNIAQLRKKYGPDGAATLLACFRTKIIFNPGDAETAKRMAEEIGKQTIDRLEVSHSKGPGHGSTTKSWRREENFAVSPEKLQQLPDLSAYLKLGGDYPVAKITVARA